MALAELKDEIINCKKCPLYKTRNMPVVGEGNENADVMLIGEAPGFNEDRTGHPFCGKSGEILDELLSSICLKREDVYITNVVKCRPPNNRNPTNEEIKACSPYLSRQIALIGPEAIGAMGNFATNFIFEHFNINEHGGISKLHGRVFERNTLLGKIKIVPLYHPAVAVYNINMKDILKEDFKKLIL